MGTHQHDYLHIGLNYKDGMDLSFWRDGGSILWTRGVQNIPVAKMLSAVASSAVAVTVVAIDRAYLITVSVFQHK